MNSDFKNNRVENPTAINDKQQKKVRNYCKEYFEKAVVKHREHEKKAGKGTKEAGHTANGESDEGVDVKMSDDEGGKDTPGDGEETETPGSSLKRKRDDDPEKEDGKQSPSPSKRQRSSTPPPPPPPPMSPGQAESTPTDKQAIQATPTPPPPPPIPAEQS